MGVTNPTGQRIAESSGLYAGGKLAMAADVSMFNDTFSSLANAERHPCSLNSPNTRQVTNSANGISTKLNE